MKGFQMKVSIRDSKPNVWRRITIPTDATFYQLHQVLQAAFGWMDCHLHDFTIPAKGVRICDEELEGIEAAADEDAFLFEYLSNGTRLIYTYDFGDGWKHDILIEKEIELEETYPRVEKWKGDNFAEDAGNVYGYYHILERSLDPEDPQQQQYIDWIKIQHIPFNLPKVNLALSEITVELYTNTMSEDVCKQLDEAILSLRQQLWKKTIERLSLVILETPELKKYIGFNRVQDDITLQIYDQESEYLQGVDYVSSHSQGNLFANAICIILSEEEIPIRCWKTSDHMAMAKRMKPGCFPVDLSDEDALSTIEVLTYFTQALRHWKKKQFPTYETNECLHAVLDQTWNLSVEAIRLQRSHDSLHLTQDQIAEFQAKKEQEDLAYEDFKIDLISIPGEQVHAGKMDVIFIIETTEYTFETTLEHEELSTLQAMNESILYETYSYMMNESFPKRIIVNNENMRIMLSGFCEDLGIALLVEPFVTTIEADFMDILEDTDMQILDTLADMTPDEFFEFMSKMDDEELHEFQSFLQQYMDVEAYEDLFSQVDSTTEDTPKRKLYDA